MFAVWLETDVQVKRFSHEGHSQRFILEATRAYCCSLLGGGSATPPLALEARFNKTGGLAGSSVW